MNSMSAPSSPLSSGLAAQPKAAARAPSQGLLRRVPRALSILVALAVAVPGMAGMAQAQTADGLPKGYTSDELPTLPSSGQPSSQAAAPQAAGQPEAQPVSDGVEVSAEVDFYADTDPSALSDFREPLAAHGTWVEDSTYGTVWVPSSAVVGADFAPYQTAGHWSLTEEGDWLWVSDYEWGYIPFHYGRWVWIGGRGWSWIPGRTYAPAWVAWRVSDYGYVGWAPLPPSYYWSHGAAVGLWVNPHAAYVFCPTSYVFHHHVHTYVVRDQHIVRRIGAHSQAYRPARASVGAPSHAPAQASPGGQSSAKAPRSAFPKGPSLAEARIPASAAPKTRAAQDQRALALATRSGTARAKTLSPAARGGSHAPSRVLRGAEMPSRERADVGGADARPRQPVIRTPATQPQRGFERAPNAFPESRPRIRTSRPPQSIGGGHSPAPTRVAPSAPSRIAPPSAPSRVAPPSAPSRVAPSTPTPRSVQPSAQPSRRSAPSSAPAVRPSAPAARPAPARSAPAPRIHIAPSTRSAPHRK